MNNETRYVVIFWDGDVRECWVDNGVLIHVLNSEFRIDPRDPRIKEIKPIKNG